jgi:SAM-dependent methyltransferase
MLDMRKRTELIEDYYEFNTDIPPRFISECELSFLDQICIHGMNILDVGCGSGRVYRNLKSDVTYTGLDIKKYQNPKFDFVRASSLNLPFSEEVFDLILLLGHTFGHMNEAERLETLKNTRRCIKNTGYMMLGVWNFFTRSIDLPENRRLDDTFPIYESEEKNHMLYLHFFRPDELIYMLGDCGFRLRELYTLDFYDEKIIKGLKNHGDYYILLSDIK